MKRERVRVKARVTSKGQITIPLAVRSRLDIRPGDDLEFIEGEDGDVRLRRHPRGYLEGLKKWEGYLKDMEGVDVDGWLDEVRGR